MAYCVQKFLQWLTRSLSFSCHAGYDDVLLCSFPIASQLAFMCTYRTRHRENAACCRPAACCEHSSKWNVKGGSRQNFKNRMDVRRQFYLQKKNVLVTTFECMMHQFHEKLNWKFRTTEGSETTVVPSGTGKGNSDIVHDIYSSLLFPVLLFNFILVFVIVTFWAWTKNTMVYHCVSECAGWSFLLAARLTADERKDDVEMTSHFECFA